MIASDIPLVVIVGPTASGKTDLAVKLAQKYNGEIVCADSRTIYRDMNLGTAKPSPVEQGGIKHHLLDVVDPGETLSVAAYKVLAEAAIAEIASRGKVPFLVGGSGLYIDAILFDYQFPTEADPARRAQLENMPHEDLLELLAAENPAAFETIDKQNRRRVIRAIETAGQAMSRQYELRPLTLVLGLALDKKVIHERAASRINKTLQQGIIAEVRKIGSTYGWDNEAMSGNAYRAFKEVVLGTKTVEQGIEDNLRSDMQLYKKQLTWFKRNKSIVWLEDPLLADGMVSKFLKRTV